MLKNDQWIRMMAQEREMIVPFAEHTRVSPSGARLLSYGLSSYGYDIRVGDTFKVFTNLFGAEIDPKNFNPSGFIDRVARDGYITIPPNSFALARTIETFKIPRKVLAVCIGKSTYARCGLVVGITPAEPEWQGTLTIEISNTTPMPARVYANEGIAQMLFFESDQACETSYADRRGKYQDQVEVTLPRV